MFKQRTLTALALVPLVLLAIYYGDPKFLATLVVLITVALGWEWLALIPIKQGYQKVAFILILLLLLVPSVLWLAHWLILALPLWGLILLAILFYPQSQAIWGYRLIVAGCCLYLLPLLASAARALYQLPQGQDLLLYVMCLIWAIDIGAYLIGKQWGRHKLIPLVSPGKTLEGLLGGLLFGLIVVIIGWFYFKPHYFSAWVLVSIATLLISVVGDLFISMLKRRCDLKDTGYIFPGHGGILDRLDSMIAALPLFYWGVVHFILLVP